MNNLDTVTANLFLLSNYKPNYLTIVVEHGLETLKVKGLTQRFFDFITLNSSDKSIKKLIESYKKNLLHSERSLFFHKNGDATELFFAIHRFNHSQANNIVLEDVPEAAPVKVSHGQKNGTIINDTPVVLQERRFFILHKTLRYPGDNSDHSSEAKSIFFNTQRERLLSFIGRIIECIAHLFGSSIQAFQKYHYANGHETENQIYSNDSPLNYANDAGPTSYWLGHASLLLNVPLTSKNRKLGRFNIITDPVEGHLNHLLYPRQTRFARPMESLPACNIFLLSHNHLDHCDVNSYLKLLPQQPMMIVPKGDGKRFKDQGFKNVIELRWWEKETLKLQQGNETFHLNITATPARHWAGQGPCSGHESSFGGYVIEADGGDIYFAGDTARLNEDHINKLRNKFNIRWSFQPGGPDEVRKDMESTHQSSADGLLMHFLIMLKKHYKPNMEKEAFVKAISQHKTIFMHTMTFKLGNLHLNDTFKNIERILDAFIRPDFKLKPYEEAVFNELKAIIETFSFANGQKFDQRELVDLIRKTVLIPKIGSRLDLNMPANKEKLFGNA